MKEEREIETGPGTHFLRMHGWVDPDVVITTLKVYPDHLGQPHAGPLLRYNETWMIRGDRMRRESVRLVPTPLAELDRIAALAQAGKRGLFNDSVPKSSQARLWTVLKNRISVECEHKYEYGECDTMSVWNDQIHDPGSVDLIMHFAKRQGHWRLVRATKKK